MGFYGVFDFLIILCGLYLLYAAFMMKKNQEIIANVLLGKNTDVKKIKDKEGFIQYMYPKLTVLGLITTVAGIINVISSFTNSSNIAVTMGSFVFVIALIVYGVCVRTAQKKFF